MRGFVEKDFPRLLDLLYQAALDPACWQAFLDALPTSFGGANGVLYAASHQGPTRFGFNFGCDPAFVASYVAHYHKLNPYAGGSLRLPLGVSSFATRVVDEEKLLRSEYYNDWMRPQGIPADHLGALLHWDGSVGVVLGIAPNASIYDKHQQQYVRQLDLLLPHLSRAIELNRTVAQTDLWRQGAAEALEFLRGAAFLLDMEGRIQLTNELAEELLRTERVVMAGRHATLTAAHPAEDGRLQAAITASARRPRVTPVRLHSQQSGGAFVAWVMSRPVKETHSQDSHVLFKSLSPSGAVLVLIVPLGSSTLVAPDAIATVFGLTVAEARLASALVAAQTLAEYALKTGLSRNTVHNQLASVFAKTRTSRQAELVAMIVGALPRLIAHGD